MLTIAIGGCFGESKLELSHNKSVFFLLLVLLVEEKGRSCHATHVYVQRMQEREEQAEFLKGAFVSGSRSP